KWVTMHGYALNVKPNLNFYNGLIPCGIFEHGVTSIFELMNIRLKMFEIVKKNIIQFERKLK
ncbi:MAG: lipoate-protein ligase B, partial [Candidatus Marinimicrobia bacterium]|nr:lipoate-protein ligase B [Candidatus Neomarinimicrobiota bacterium]